jgi:predicted transposase YdaD
MTTPNVPDDRDARGPFDPLDPATLPPDDDPANNPHDTFVKRVFTSPEAAGVELRMLLPPALVEQLVWSTLRVVPISFVDPNLAERESDILYAIDLAATGRPVFVYVLLEHQSTIDVMMAWRFLRYLACIWERWERDQGGKATSLPLIVPLLMFQGPSGWTAPRRLSALLDVPPELAALGSPVELVFDVDDLRQAIVRDSLARYAIIAFVETARVLLLATRAPLPLDPALMARVMALGPQVDLVHRELGPEAVHTLLRYITSALPPGSPLRDTILDVITEEKRAMYMSVYDEMRAEGRAEGIDAGKAEGKREGKAEGQREGRAEGKAEGKAELLLKVLAQRGLVLEGDLRARITGCTNEAQIERWFDRALAGSTLAGVFDEP